MEDNGSQLDNTERNASDGDGDNGTDAEGKEDEVQGGSQIVQTPVRPDPSQPSESQSLLENSPYSSGQQSEPKFSTLSIVGGLLRGVVPGQPSHPQSMRNVFDSSLTTIM